MQFLLQGYNWDPSYSYSIPNLLLEHLIITAVSMGIGLVIAFPLALLIARYPRLYTPILTTSSVVYTIPSLAFMAFLIPYTQLTIFTVVIPLVLYAQIVLIRNIVAAIRAVDPTLVEVGRAMGMNWFQLQTRVVLPLALPIIMAGVRVATVTTIGIATIAGLFGTYDLGFLITQGFNLAYNDQVLAGVILVSLLAIIADLSLLGVQRLLSRGQQIVPAV